MLTFGYTIIYVPDVPASLAFFEQAFGIRQRFLHESGGYGELETGATVLAFAAHELGNANLPDGYVSASTSPKPLGIEIALVADDVSVAHANALQAGAVEIQAPAQKPWGQWVSYVRCPDDVLVELCSPMS